LERKNWVAEENTWSNITNKNMETDILEEHRGGWNMVNRQGRATHGKVVCNSRCQGIKLMKQRERKVWVREENASKIK
jgi:hypothetical protein